MTIWRSGAPAPDEPMDLTQLSAQRRRRAVRRATAGSGSAGAPARRRRTTGSSRKAASTSARTLRGRGAARAARGDRRHVGAPARPHRRTGSPTSSRPSHRGSKARQGLAGQKQVWFALALRGRRRRDRPRRPRRHVEFDAWRWAELDEALDEVIAVQARRLSPGDRGLPAAGGAGSRRRTPIQALPHRVRRRAKVRRAMTSPRS